MTVSVTNPRWLTDASARLVTAVASAAALVLVAGAGVFVAASHTTVTLEADGVTRPVSLWGRTVADAVRASGVDVGPHDAVSPALGTHLRDGQRIEIDRARRLTVRNGSHTRDFWTTAADLSGALEDLEASGRSGTITASRSYVRGEIPTLAASGTPITVFADGSEVEVRASAEMTVPSALEAAGIEVSPIDRVTVSGTGKAVRIEVVRVKRGNVTTTEEIAYDVDKRATDDLYEGQTRVITEGQPGKIVTTRYQEKRGEVLLVDVLVSREETKPVTQVEEYGTQARPAAAPSGGGGGAVGGDVWAALARCESGGNPATNTGNGYYGMYQFSLGTWQSVGGTGLPSDASAAEQTKRAQILQQRAGWGQWPACARQLGLR